MVNNLNVYGVPKVQKNGCSLLDRKHLMMRHEPQITNVVFRAEHVSEFVIAPGNDKLENSSTGTSTMKSDSVTKATSSTSGLENSLADR